MDKDEEKSKKAEDLRRRAEEILLGKVDQLQYVSSQDIKSLVHELQTHMIELEMQNEELRRTQLELEKSRDRFSNLYDFSPIGYFTLDKTGLIIEANLTGASKLGVARIYLFRKSFYNFIGKESKDKLFLHLQKVFSTGKVATCELKITCTDGAQFYAHIESKPLEENEGKFNLCSTSITDITKIKEIEHKLLENEYFLTESQRVGNIGAYKTDFTTGVWKSTEILDQIFGIDQNYNKNVQGWLELVHPDDREMMDQYLREEVIAKRQPFNKEYRIIRKSDGEIRWVNGYGETSFDSEGKIISMIGTIQDVTERKKTADIINNLLKEKEIFLKEVHHRIKNNMANISSLLSLQTYRTTNQETIGFLKDAQSRVISMMVLYDKLYLSPSYKELSLKTYLTDLVKSILINFANREIVKTETEIDDVMITVEVLSPLGIIINEIITNAMKYAFIDRENGLISVTAKVKENQVTIVIADNGPGMRLPADSNP